MDSIINSGAKYYFDESNRLDSVRVDNYRRYAYYYDYAGRRVKKLYITGNRCDSTEWSVSNSNQYCDHGTSGCWFYPGDVNGNGNCNGLDLTYLVSYLKGGTAPPYPIFRADVNCSGNVNGIDITYLQYYFTGGGPAPKCCYWLRTDTTTTYYVYSGDQLIAEYGTSTTTQDKYVYGGGLNPIAKFNSTNGKRFYIHDIRASVAAVLSLDGNTVFSSYDYYPFGQVLSVSGSDDRHKYVGKELDDAYDVDLYYFGARYYDASLGRFISPDPIRSYLNPYSYSENDPIMLTDPYGNIPWPLIIFVAYKAAEFYCEHKEEIDHIVLADGPEIKDKLGEAAGKVGDWMSDNRAPAADNFTGNHLDNGRQGYQP